MSLLPWLLVTLGLAMLLAAWAVWHRGRRISRCISQLLALPADMHPLRWPDRARPVLEQAGIAGLHWQGQWFGDAVQGQWGAPSEPDWPSQSLQAGPDCQILLRWADVARTNEARGLALAVVDVFAQTWLSRMRERTQAVAVALAQRAHVQLYWQHDMRNLAQWVGLLAEEFGAATPEQLPRLAERLQRQAPLALARAQKLLQATQAADPQTPEHAAAQGESSANAAPQADVRVVLRNAAELAGLSMDVELDDAVPGADLQSVLLVSEAVAQALERALDNIFSNITRDPMARHTEEPLRCLCAVHQGVLQGQLHTPALSTPWPRRAFEPLKSAAGSGMGLYQARRSLRDVGGDLQAHAVQGGVQFGLTVPLAPGQGRQEI